MKHFETQKRLESPERLGRSGRLRSLGVSLLILALFAAAPAAAQSRCPNGKSSNGAMWFSILHPGLGEYFLNDWGSWEKNMPQKKFYLGFIPGYGWPGYLQVVSAIDAKNCRTDDNLNTGPN